MNCMYYDQIRAWGDSYTISKYMQAQYGHHSADTHTHTDDYRQRKHIASRLTDFLATSSGDLALPILSDLLGILT